ncbi:MAG: hypothetical protein PUH99_01935 [Firmicutes bacterium]|nr:hypothetical protein [Bacillota bacterium]MDY5531619.1 hypothetical protein [Pumilibacteraceae bacterium]
MKNKTIKKTILCIVAAIMIVLPLFGGAAATARAEDKTYAIDKNPPDTINYYDRKYGSLQYVTIEMVLSAETIGKLNADAEKAAAEGEKIWTVDDYFDTFAEIESASASACEKKTDGNGNTTYVIPLVTSYSSPLDQNDGYTAEKGFYFVDYSLSYVNPLIKLGKKLFENEQKDYSGLNDWQITLAAGYYNRLPALVEAFPCLKTADTNKINITYNRSVPKLYHGGNANADLVTYGATRYMRWTNGTDDWQTLMYTYSRPYSLGWGVTIVIISLCVTAILIFVSVKKKEQPSFADYRPLAEAETMRRVENKINGTAPDGGENAAAEPENEEKDGYAGHGVFNENGKTVDVFGNDATSAPEERKDENNDN